MNLLWYLCLGEAERCVLLLLTQLFLDFLLFEG